MYTSFPTAGIQTLGIRGFSGVMHEDPELIGLLKKTPWIALKGHCLHECFLKKTQSWMCFHMVHCRILFYH